LQFASSAGQTNTQFRGRSLASFSNPGITPDAGLVSVVVSEFELFLKSMTDFFLKSITALLLAFASSTSFSPRTTYWLSGLPLAVEAVLFGAFGVVAGGIVEVLGNGWHTKRPLTSTL
jgi:hypothetical protein